MHKKYWNMPYKYVLKIMKIKIKYKMKNIYNNNHIKIFKFKLVQKGKFINTYEINMYNKKTYFNLYLKKINEYKLLFK